jgi:hypothetical protein
MKRRRALVVAAGVVLAYLGAYGGFRATHLEVAAHDGSAYVLFPEDATWLYYLFRPLSYADGMLTGVGTHLGPHLPDQGP